MSWWRHKSVVSINLNATLIGPFLSRDQNTDRWLATGGSYPNYYWSLSWDQSNRISRWDKIQWILKSQLTNIWMRVCWDIILLQGSRQNAFLRRFIRCVNAKKTRACLACPLDSFMQKMRVRESFFGRYHVNACTAFFERYRYLEDAGIPCVCFRRYLRVAQCMI